MAKSAVQGIYRKDKGGLSIKMSVKRGRAPRSGLMQWLFDSTITAAALGDTNGVQNDEIVSAILSQVEARLAEEGLKSYWTSPDGAYTDVDPYRNNQKQRVGTYRKTYEVVFERHDTVHGSGNLPQQVGVTVIETEHILFGKIYHKVMYDLLCFGDGWRGAEIPSALGGEVTDREFIGIVANYIVKAELKINE